MAWYPTPYTTHCAETQWHPCVFHHCQDQCFLFLGDEATLSAVDAEVHQSPIHSCRIHALTATMAGNKSQINSNLRYAFGQRELLASTGQNFEGPSHLPHSAREGLLALALRTCRIYFSLSRPTFIFSGKSLPTILPINSQCTSLSPCLFSLNLDINVPVLNFNKLCPAYFFELTICYA